MKEALWSSLRTQMSDHEYDIGLDGKNVACLLDAGDDLGGRYRWCGGLREKMR